jgi:hypothetical protein
MNTLKAVLTSGASGPPASLPPPSFYEGYPRFKAMLLPAKAA